MTTKIDRNLYEWRRLDDFAKGDMILREGEDIIVEDVIYGAITILTYMYNGVEQMIQKHGSEQYLARKRGTQMSEKGLKQDLDSETRALIEAHIVTKEPPHFGETILPKPIESTAVVQDYPEVHEQQRCLECKRFLKKGQTTYCEDHAYLEHSEKVKQPSTSHKKRQVKEPLVYTLSGLCNTCGEPLDESRIYYCVKCVSGKGNERQYMIEWYARKKRKDLLDASEEKNEVQDMRSDEELIDVGEVMPVVENLHELDVHKRREEEEKEKKLVYSSHNQDIEVIVTQLAKINESLIHAASAGAEMYEFIGPFADGKISVQYVKDEDIDGIC